MIYFITKQKELLIHETIVSTDSIDVVIDYFKDKKIIEVDTETTGYFNHENRIIYLQLGNAENQFVIDFQFLNAEEKNKIKILLMDDNTIKILMNAKFDIKFLWFEGLDIKNVYDVMLAEMLIYAGKETPKGFFSLKEISKRRLGIDLDKEVRGMIHHQKYNLRVIQYAASDVEYLSLIREQQINELVDLKMSDGNCQNIYTVLGLENNAVIPISSIEYNGIALNTNKWEEVRIEVLKELKTVENEILEEAINLNLKKFYHVYQDLFTEPENRLSINLNSPDQKLQLLKSVIPEIEDTSELTLSRYKSHNIVKLLIKYSKTNKLLTAFANKLIHHINPKTKRIHTDFHQILDTGRMSSSNPNLQQIPARSKLGSKMRECFIPSSTYKFVGGDFSGCELRLLAQFSQDPLWINSFLEGKDLHSVLCAATFGIDMEDVKKPSHFKEEISYRDIQKTLNFG